MQLQEVRCQIRKAPAANPPSPLHISFISLSLPGASRIIGTRAADRSCRSAVHYPYSERHTHSRVALGRSIHSHFSFFPLTPSPTPSSARTDEAPVRSVYTYARRFFFALRNAIGRGHHSHLYLLTQASPLFGLWSFHKQVQLARFGVSQSRSAKGKAKLGRICYSPPFLRVHQSPSYTLCYSTLSHPIS
jgi:hypothetical protein